MYVYTRRCSERGQSITLSLVFRNGQPTEQLVFIPLSVAPCLRVLPRRTGEAYNREWFKPETVFDIRSDFTIYIHQTMNIIIVQLTIFVFHEKPRCYASPYRVLLHVFRKRVIKRERIKILNFIRWIAKLSRRFVVGEPINDAARADGIYI